MARLSPVRQLHAGAWWLWALAVMVTATRTVNPWILVALAAVITIVVLACQGQLQAFRMYAIMAGALVVLRIVFRVVFGGHLTPDALLAGFTTGAQLGVLVLCVGAANALASPKRLLALLPGALYELGTTIVVAVTVFPQLAESARRVQRSRQLRDDKGPWRHMIRDVAIPVLADTLDRSLLLAGAMDARGYGRAGAVTVAARRATTVLLTLAMAVLGVGAFMVFMPTTDWLGWVILAVGAALAVAGFRAAGRRVQRTRYRPDPWRGSEWAMTGCAVAIVAASALLPPVAPLVALVPAALFGGRHD